MSYTNRLGERLAARDVDVALAKLGLLASVLLLGLRLLADQVFLVVIPLATGTACATYLATHDRTTTEEGLPGLPAGASGYLPAVVVGLTAVLAVAVTLTPGRPVAVLLLTGAIGTLVIAQILLVRDAAFGPGVVLFEILAVAVVVRLSALFGMPGYVGADVWVHGPIWVAGIAETGSLAPLAESKYLLAPFYHAVGAVGALVFGSARVGIYLTVGLFVPLSAVFVYGVGSLFVPARWALLATALYAFADQFVRWGLHLIPTSLGLAFFLVVLYCSLKLLYTDAQPWVALGLFAFSLAIVFTHQVSTGITLVLLLVAAVVAVVSDVVDVGGWRRSTGVLVAAFLTTLAATVATWSTAPWTGGGADAGREVFLFRMVALARNSLLNEAGFLDLVSSGSGSTAGAAGGGLAAAAVPYVELFGFALLLAGAVVGGLVMLHSRQRADASLTLLITGAVLFVGTFGLTLFGVRVFLPGRWIGFLYVPLAVVAAIGIYHVVQRAPRGVMVGVVLLVAVGYPTTMVVAEKATLDDPAFEDRYSRVAFTDAELAAADSIDELLTTETAAQVRTDHPYWRAYHPRATGEVGTIEMTDAGPAGNGPVVYRSYQATGAATYHLSGAAGGTVAARSYERSDVCPDARNHVYGNGDVLLCTVPTDGGEGA